MNWLPFATRVPLRTNFRPEAMSRHPYGLVLHLTTGHPNFSGLRATWSHPDQHVSAHFAVARDGRVAQFVDMQDVAFAVGGDAHRNDDQFWYSVENVGRVGEALTPEQIEGCARILAFLNRNGNVMLQLANDREGRGLGFHSMFRRGTHLHCPGNGVIAQRKAILDRAMAIAAGP